MFLSNNMFEITTARDHRNGKESVCESSFLYPFKDDIDSTWN